MIYIPLETLVWIMWYHSILKQPKFKFTEEKH